jgi:hypothetical protein
MLLSALTKNRSEASANDNALSNKKMHQPHPRAPISSVAENLFSHSKAKKRKKKECSVEGGKNCCRVCMVLSGICIHERNLHIKVSLLSSCAMGADVWHLLQSYTRVRPDSWAIFHFEFQAGCLEG